MGGEKAGLREILEERMKREKLGAADWEERVGEITGGKVCMCREMCAVIEQ